MKKEERTFVKQHSIVRTIWGSSDCILLVFAGSSAEFAINKSVDWLYYTGKLPSDPLKRFLSTVSYARTIVFSNKQVAEHAILSINKIHSSLEKSRGYNIPQKAYRDVLYMLIDYSIRSYETLERPLTYAEKQEVFDVFFRMGKLMEIKDLPTTYEEWKIDRKSHMENNLVYSDFTKDLYSKYRIHLGGLRFCLLKEIQYLIVPETVGRILKFDRKSFIQPILAVYKLFKSLNIHKVFVDGVLPTKYQPEINSWNK